MRVAGWNRSQWFSLPREHRRPLARMNVAPEEYWHARLEYTREQCRKLMAEMIYGRAS